jgi:uncharacterized membrane protein
MPATAIVDYFGRNVEFQTWTIVGLVLIFLGVLVMNVSSFLHQKRQVEIVSEGL